MLPDLKPIFLPISEVTLRDHYFEAIHLDGINQGWVFKIRDYDGRIFICHLTILTGLERREIDFFFTRSKFQNAYTLFATVFPSWDCDDPDRFYLSWLQAIPTTLIHTFDESEARVYREIIEEVVDNDESNSLFSYLLHCVFAVSLKYDLRIETQNRSLILFNETNGSMYPGIAIKFQLHEKGIMLDTQVCSFQNKEIQSKADVPGFNRLIVSTLDAQVYSLWLEATILSVLFWLESNVHKQNDLFTVLQQTMEKGGWMTPDSISAQSLYFEIESITRAKITNQEARFNFSTPTA